MFMHMYEWIYINITGQYNLIFKFLEVFYTEKWGFKIALSTFGNLEEILICNLVRWPSKDYSKQGFKQDMFLSHTCYPSASDFPFHSLIYLLSISQTSLESMCFFTTLLDLASLLFALLVPFPHCHISTSLFPSPGFPFCLQLVNENTSLIF